MTATIRRAIWRRAIGSRAASSARRIGPAPSICRWSISIPAFVHARFPLISEACRRVGLDLARDRIPVGPAAHYVMGGVQTDLEGRTSMPGVYAAGEVACTGVHGANRLASNSLLEGLVFGARAGCAMRDDKPGDWPTETSKVLEFDASVIAAASRPRSAAARSRFREVQDLMWRQRRPVPGSRRFEPRAGDAGSSLARD